MIQVQTMLKVADNSGAKKVQCIRLMNGYRRHYASIGDMIMVTVKEAVPHAAVKKSDVLPAVIVRTTKEIRRPDGSYIRFDENACVIVDKKFTEKENPLPFSSTPRGITELVRETLFIR